MPAELVMAPEAENGPAAQTEPPPLQREYFSTIEMVLDAPSLKLAGMRAPKELLTLPRLLGSPNATPLIA